VPLKEARRKIGKLYRSLRIVAGGIPTIPRQVGFLFSGGRFEQFARDLKKRPVFRQRGRALRELVDEKIGIPRSLDLRPASTRGGFGRLKAIGELSGFLDQKVEHAGELGSVRAKVLVEILVDLWSISGRLDRDRGRS
jgi:hypothetical protein